MLAAMAWQSLVFEIPPKCLAAARSVVMAAHMPPTPSVSAYFGRAYVIDYLTLWMPILDHRSTGDCCLAWMCDLGAAQFVLLGLFRKSISNFISNFMLDTGMFQQIVDRMRQSVVVNFVM